MIRAYLCLPLRGDVAANVQTAKSLATELAHRGLAVFAPHLLYPQFLDDDDLDERDLGIRSALAFLPACNLVWAYVGHGVSEGMSRELAEAASKNIPVVRQRHLIDLETPLRAATALLTEGSA